MCIANVEIYTCSNLVPHPYRVHANGRPVMVPCNNRIDVFKDIVTFIDGRTGASRTERIYGSPHQFLQGEQNFDANFRRIIDPPIEPEPCSDALALGQPHNRCTTNNYRINVHRMQSQTDPLDRYCRRCLDATEPERMRQLEHDARNTAQEIQNHAARRQR